MIGSPQEAEDVLQEPLLGAWQGLGGFEDRLHLPMLILQGGSDYQVPPSGLASWRAALGSSASVIEVVCSRPVPSWRSMRGPPGRVRCASSPRSRSCRCSGRDAPRRRHLGRPRSVL
ncbi:MAG: hypothetical protein ACYDH5_11100 [Acidimicrobiales bacterium]